MSEKQIEVRRRKSSYTNIQNRLIWDDNLRPQTKWLLIAMLSLPEDWDFSIRGLAAKAKLSKDTIAKMLAELETAGYLMRKAQAHGGNGRFGGTAYILTDVPFDFGEDEPCPNLPYTVPPYTEKSPQQNTILQTKEQINPLPPSHSDADAVKTVLDDFLENRRKKKSPLQTRRQASLLVNNLEKHSGGDRACKVALLEKAILLGWKGIYPLKPGDMPPPPDTGQSAPLRGQGVRYI